MAHRKIITLTVKLVVDIDNDDIEATRNSEEYNVALDNKIEKFIENTECSISSDSIGNVSSVEIIDYDTRFLIDANTLG